MAEAGMDRPSRGARKGVAVLAGASGAAFLLASAAAILFASDFDALGSAGAMPADPRLVMVEAPGHPYFAMACLSARATGRADRCFRKTAARKTEAPGPRERPCPNPPLQ